MQSSDQGVFSASWHGDLPVFKERHLPDTENLGFRLNIRRCVINLALWFTPPSLVNIEIILCSSDGYVLSQGCPNYQVLEI